MHCSFLLFFLYVYFLFRFKTINFLYVLSVLVYVPSFISLLVSFFVCVGFPVACLVNKTAITRKLLLFFRDIACPSAKKKLSRKINKCFYFFGGDVVPIGEDDHDYDGDHDDDGDGNVDEDGDKKSETL